MTKLILLFPIFLICPITQQSSLSALSKYIGWVSISKSAIPLAHNYPDGKESSVFTYLCRTKHESGVYAGKFYWGSDCYFGRGGVERKNGKFEIFAAPPGSVSWIIYKDTLPENAIFVGLSREGLALYVCRGWANNNRTMLIPGYFEPTAAVCYITLGSELFPREGIELLVKNNYGLLLSS